MLGIKRSEWQAISISDIMALPHGMCRSSGNETIANQCENELTSERGDIRAGKAGHERDITKGFTLFSLLSKVWKEMGICTKLLLKICWFYSFGQSSFRWQRWGRHIWSKELADSLLLLSTAPSGHTSLQTQLCCQKGREDPEVWSSQERSTIIFKLPF